LNEKVRRVRKEKLLLIRKKIGIKEVCFVSESRRRRYVGEGDTFATEVRLYGDELK
jgi:hypothetical protein